MEWRKKEGIALPEIGPVPPGGYTEEVEETLWKYREDNPDKAPVQMGKKPPGKKEATAIDKAAQGLFFVETRARYNDIMVRMDLQLYRVDDQNYLVDFRNMSYFPVSETTGGRARNGAAVPTDAAGSLLPESSPVASSVPKGKDSAGTQPIGGVSGPFHFLEMACQLIAELASG
jgi:carbon catabolite-derepressing protein kinase